MPPKGVGFPDPLSGTLKEYNKYKYYFRTFLNSNQMAEQMGKQLSDMMTTYKKDKVAIIAETAVWVEPIVDSLKSTLGPKLVALERVSTNAKDLSVELSRVQERQGRDRVRDPCGRRWSAVRPPMGRPPDPGARHWLYGDGAERPVLGADRRARAGVHDLEARRARSDQPEDDPVLG